MSRTFPTADKAPREVLPSSSSQLDSCKGVSSSGIPMYPRSHSALDCVPPPPPLFLKLFRRVDDPVPENGSGKPINHPA